MQELTVVAPLQDEEIARMCFFVEGVVEKATLNDPKSADQPAMVPGGLIPEAQVPTAPLRLWETR